MEEKYVISDELTVKQAIEKMEEEHIKAVVVVDKQNKVIGLFSNGDMRNFFLKGGSLSDNIKVAMNKHPHLYHSEEEIMLEREETKRVIYPIIDSENYIIKIIDYESEKQGGGFNSALKQVPLVIMAGGKGTRLYPFTKILPKPLIPIGDLTITERIIQSFEKYGCQNIIMVLNYKANMIKAYMNDLKKDYCVDFVEEKEFLGTAGGLRLLRDRIKSTFFLSNCDILINADLECVYKTHKAKGNKITIVCFMKDVIIPYGVVETDQDGMITSMQEKPGFSYLINTGLYMIEPEVIDEIKEGEFIHMPELAQSYLERGEKVGVFPISEKAWLDMGQFSEMENMMKSLGLK